MELRGKDKETGMASSMGGYNNRDANSSKVSISAVGMGEMIRDQAAYNNIHGGGIFNLPQTLGHQHQHPPPPPPLYHHDHYHQFNPHPQENKQRGPSNPDVDPDPVSIANTTTASTSTREANRSGQRSPAAAVPTPPPAQAPITSTAIVTSPSIRYKECLKNHAASTGSHVVDGCGEFMPSGEDETPEALKCAACECHRNFHRKEIDGEPQSYPQSQSAANSFYTYNHHHNHNHPSRNSNHTNTINRLQQQPPPYYHQHHRIAYTSPQTASIAPMMMTFGGGGGSSGGLEESSSEDLNKFHSSAAGQTSVQPKKKKKRFRTKFTQEQKEKMTEFAEKLEWRIQKQDDEAVHDFCAEIGVKRQVFKVWMHNNKQASSSKKKIV